MDQRVAEFGELAGERLARRVVLRRLARVEPEILEHDDFAVLERRDRVDGRAVVLAEPVGPGAARGHLPGGYRRTGRRR